MTEAQFNEIQERLKVWREERNLTQDSQRDNLVNNIKEELSEYAAAQNEYEGIDAICDVAVLVFNSYELKYPILYNVSRCVSIDMSQTPKYSDVINEYIAGLGDTEVYAYLILFVCRLYIEQGGFDFYKCMMECIKHIESRQQDPNQKQEWDKLKDQGLTLVGKWQKDKNQDKSTIYESDYESCRVELSNV